MCEIISGFTNYCSQFETYVSLKSIVDSSEFSGTFVTLLQTFLIIKLECVDI